MRMDLIFGGLVGLEGEREVRKDVWGTYYTGLPSLSISVAGLERRMARMTVGTRT